MVKIDRSGSPAPLYPKTSTMDDPIAEGRGLVFGSVAGLTLWAVIACVIWSVVR